MPLSVLTWMMLTVTRVGPVSSPKGNPRAHRRLEMRLGAGPPSGAIIVQKMHRQSHLPSSGAA